MKHFSTTAIRLVIAEMNQQDEKLGGAREILICLETEHLGRPQDYVI